MFPLWGRNTRVSNQGAMARAQPRSKRTGENWENTFGKFPETPDARGGTKGREMWNYRTGGEDRKRTTTVRKTDAGCA